ncbi:MAG: hypothetical protein PHW62_06050, partial [Candidatus Ratteibacteria bacterium]|nr:hypothetical protein [Candidatus Ratteibacteria bacterium]
MSNNLIKKENVTVMSNVITPTASLAMTTKEQTAYYGEDFVPKPTVYSIQKDDMLFLDKSTGEPLETFDFVIFCTKFQRTYFNEVYKRNPMMYCQALDGKTPKL